jgi:hypothetical protein
MKYLLKILLFILILVGCSYTPTINDKEFEIEYIQPFLAQADAYNIRTYNASLTILYTDRLIVNNETVAANTDIYTQTITFNTSHEYWNSEAKIILIYHELAHYYLSKGHIDIRVSCDIPFSIMSLWSKEHSPTQYEYWVSGKWRELEEYYMEELFKGSNVWYKYLDHKDILSHEIDYPCWK